MATPTLGSSQEEQDPFQAGRPEWQERPQALARQWHAGLGLEHDGVPIGKCVEYVVMDWLTREFDAAERTND